MSTTFAEAGWQGWYLHIDSLPGGVSIDQQVDVLDWQSPPTIVAIESAKDGLPVGIPVRASLSSLWHRSADKADRPTDPLS